MDTPPLTVDLDRSGRQLTVYVSGMLDAETAASFVETVTGQLRPNDQVVWLDLAAIAMCDDAGAEALAIVHRTVTEAGGLLRLYNPAPAVGSALAGCEAGTTISIWTQSGAEPAR